MHLLLWAEDSEVELHEELSQLRPDKPGPAPHPLFVETDFPVPLGTRLPHLVFARQWLPHAQEVKAESIRTWATALLEIIIAGLPEGRPWSLHIEPHYGLWAIPRIGARAWHSAVRKAKAAGAESRALRHRQVAIENPSHPARPQEVDVQAGRNRCGLIRSALIELLQKKRRHLLRQIRHQPVPFTDQDSLVQVLLTAPNFGFVSLAASPTPFEQRHLLSPFPKGEVPVASDPAAPSRAFAKLVEAEARLGRQIQSGETCVDLGAAPGSWTYVAVNRRARVIAVDRSPLREDLVANGLVDFQRGDAFRFRPVRPVDWLLCDVIAAPEQTAALLTDWLKRGLCRQFVVTLKLRDNASSAVLARLKDELPLLTRELFLMRLCANKKEVCAFGVAQR